MTINIIVLKGDLNGKIVVVRFFFVGYIFQNQQIAEIFPLSTLDMKFNLNVIKLKLNYVKWNLRSISLVLDLLDLYISFEDLTFQNMLNRS